MRKHPTRLIPALGIASALLLALGVPSPNQASAATGDLNVFAGALKPEPWSASGPALKVALKDTHGLAYDRNTSGDPWAGSTFIADTGFCSVRVVDSSGALSTLVNAKGAHLKKFCGPATDGPANVSRLKAPHGVTYDRVHEQLYIADTGNREVVDVNLTTSNPTLSVCPKILSTSQPLISPVAITVHASTGDVYVADQGADIVAHYSYPCTSAAPDIVAGVYGSSAWNGDSQPCTSAQLSSPDGVDWDVATNALIISDTGNNEIRECAGGSIFHVLGVPGTSGSTADGTYPGGSVAISAPHGIKADGSGAIFYDEVGNNLVRRFDISSGVLTTMAGGGGSPLPRRLTKFPVAATSVTLDVPHGISFIPTSPTTADLIFSDSGANTVLRVAGVAVPI